MAISELQAIEIAHRFASRRESLGWHPNAVSVETGEFEGRVCWIVTTERSPEPVPDWWPNFPTPFTYYVDASSGELVGFRVDKTTYLLGSD